VFPPEALKDRERGLDRMTISLSTWKVTPTLIFGFAVPEDCMGTTAV
jgi:hypothetical protein